MEFIFNCPSKRVLAVQGIKKIRLLKVDFVLISNIPNMHTKFHEIQSSHFRKFQMLRYIVT